MSKRASIKKAEWNYTREESYKKSCLTIAFNNGFDLIERDLNIYKTEDSGEVLLCSPDKSKSIWYETWILLMKQFGK